MTTFIRCALRTTDVPAARRFYTEALGLALPDGPAPGALELWPLHERARAAGVPAHWLGQVGVAEPEALRARVVARGGEALGPLVAGPHGPYATLRDPWGAVLAVGAAPPDAQPPGEVAWYHLNTTDLDAAAALYAELFGWSSAPDSPRTRALRWRAGGEVVGSVADLALEDGVHASWLFCWPVADVRASAETIRALGGLALPPSVLPDGRLLAACEDPQGAAFGIISPGQPG